MINRFSLKSIPVLASLLVAGASLTAQVSTGTLMGVVRDGKGAPVAGARVILSSPALLQTRTLTTNASGEWFASLLPAGTYRVVVGKEGSVGSEASNIRVGIGTSQRVDSLTVRGIQQNAGTTVEVVASGAEIDKADTKTSSNFSADALAAIPSTGRGFEAAANLTPGLTTSTNGTTSMRGATGSNTQYRVNGSDVKDEYQGQVTGRFYIEDNIEDVEVILSPLNARNGRALGGAINVVTKSGTNEFRGSIRGQVLRNGWNALDQDYRVANRQNAVADTLRREYQVTFNGPVIKDRLWFSIGTVLQPQLTNDYSLGNNYQTWATGSVLTGVAGVDKTLAAGPAGYSQQFFDIGKPYKQKSTDNYYEGKLTGAINVNHTLEFSYSRSNSELGPRNPFGEPGSAVSRLGALGTQTEKKTVLGFNYRGVLTDTTFFDARFNKVTSEAVFPWGDPNYGTGEGFYVYFGDGSTPGRRGGYSYPFGFGITPTPDARNNRSGNANLKMFRQFFGGNHEIDAGYDYFESVRGTSLSSGAKNQFFRVGGAYTRNTGTGPEYLFPTVNWMDFGANGQADDGVRGPAPTVYQFLGQDGTTRNRMDSVYVNDQWTINEHWNLMLGMRLDRNKITDTDGSEVASSTFFSPRLKVGFDIGGDSKHLLSFTAARYGGDFSTNFTDAFIKKANSVYVIRGWAGNPYAPGDAADPTGQFGVRFVDYKTITDIKNYGPAFNFDDASKSYWVAGKNPNVGGKLKTPYNEELALSYTRNFGSGNTFSITYVNRTWKDDWAFDYEYSAANRQAIKDPTGSDPGTYYLIATRVSNSDRYTRSYNALELDWKARIDNIWSMGANWTYGRTIGNNNGGQSRTSSFRENGAEGVHYLYNHLTGVMGLGVDQFAPEGPVNTNIPHRGRLFATATLPLGKGNISYGLLVSYESGSNFDLTTSSRVTGMPTVDTFTPAPTTYTRFFGGRGQYQYNDTWSVDFKINFNVPLGLWKVMLIGDLQVNNVFNQSMPSGLATGFYNTATDPKNYLFASDPARFGTIPSTRAVDDNFWTGGRNMKASLGLRF